MVANHAKRLMFCESALSICLIARNIDFGRRLLRKSVNWKHVLFIFINVFLLINTVVNYNTVLIQFLLLFWLVNFVVFCLGNFLFRILFQFARMDHLKYHIKLQCEIWNESEIKCIFLMQWLHFILNLWEPCKVNLV